MTDIPCSSCSGKIGEMDFTVLCGMCAKPAHAKCYDINDALFNKFQRAGALPFICPICPSCKLLHTDPPAAPSAPAHQPPIDAGTIVKQVLESLAPKIEGLVRKIIAPTTGTSPSGFTSLTTRPVTNATATNDKAPTTTSTFPTSSGNVPSQQRHSTATMESSSAEVQWIDSSAEVQWTDIVKKHNKKGRKTTLGTAVDGALKEVKIPETVPKSVFYVRNLEAACTKDDVTRHLDNNGITATRVFLFPQKKHPSACITVYKSDAVKMHDPDIWDDGTVVRNWKFKPKPVDGPDASKNTENQNDSTNPANTANRSDNEQRSHATPLAQAIRNGNDSTK